MPSSGGANKLHHAMKTLVEKWDGTEAQWRDQVRLDFGENHLVPLEDQVSATIRAMGRLADVLGQVRRDCSDQSM
jgi:hypothetical protein